MKTAYFNRFSLDLPNITVAACSHQGACDNDVAHWATKISRPEAITPEKLSAELREYGAWDDDELADDKANWHRVIWIAAGNIQDDTLEANRA